jgi:sugar/nucleoside kinase (ribokinase family)
VDALPKEDGFCVIRKTTYLPGGSGTNVIVQAARLGAKCGYIATVGDDLIGIDVLKNLVSEGVDISAMAIKQGGTTLHTDIVVDPDGRKFIMLNGGDAFFSTGEDIDMRIIDDAKVFYTDLFPYAPALAGLKRARDRGVATVFNMQAGLDTMQNMGITAEMILNCLKYVDVFAPCRLGIAGLAGSEEMEDCRRFARRYFSGLMVFTRGAEGSVAYDANDQETRVPAVKVKPVDTTGAGDSYIGAFMVKHLMEDAPLDESMAFASACAAYTCTGLGARFSPNRAEVGAFLEAQP